MCLLPLLGDSTLYTSLSIHSNKIQHMALEIPLVILDSHYTLFSVKFQQIPYINVKVYIEVTSSDNNC